jgi:hypothetical protein
MPSGSEAVYLSTLLRHFVSYEEWQQWFTDNLEEDFTNLPEAVRRLVPSFPDKIVQMRHCESHARFFFQH